jgi:hypothetical protein
VYGQPQPTWQHGLLLSWAIGNKAIDERPGFLVEAARYKTARQCYHIAQRFQSCHDNRCAPVLHTSNGGSAGFNTRI